MFMNKQIPFRIVALEVDNFNILSDKVQEGTPVEVRTNYEFAVVAEQHLVMARLSYTYLQADDKLLEMSLISTFDVKPEAFEQMLQGDTFTIDPFFSQYISTINVGAARGEIHARCQMSGSVLANIILPPINLVEALPEPIVIKI